MAATVGMNNKMTAVQTTTQPPAGTAPTKPATKNSAAAKQKPAVQPSHASSPAIHKHEEFKNQLVHDVFGRDNRGRVPMEKVTMLIWQFRDDPAVVQFMAQFVARVSFMCWK